MKKHFPGAGRLRCAAAAAALAAGVLGPAASCAQMDDQVRKEVDHLLGRVATSGCEFYRAGTWYPATDARGHLERKVRYLVARNMISTAEDFIVMAATRSSMTDEAYAIRCHGGAPQPSAVWLEAELRTLRAAARKSGVPQ